MPWNANCVVSNGSCTLIQKYRKASISRHYCYIRHDLYRNANFIKMAGVAVYGKVRKEECARFNNSTHTVCSPSGTQWYIRLTLKMQAARSNGVYTRLQKKALRASGRICGESIKPVHKNQEFNFMKGIVNNHEKNSQWKTVRHWHCYGDWKLDVQPSGRL